MKLKILWAIFWLVIIGILLYFYTRGFNVSDEGWILNPAQRIASDQIPYRDFHYIYTPGVAYYIALAFKLFGRSILISRISTLIIALSTIIIIQKISQFFKKSSIVFFITTGFYLSWGPAHINFAWPVIFAIWSGLLTCLFLLYSAKKKGRYLFFLAGITTALTFLFKQNFGLALLLCNFVYFPAVKYIKKPKNILLYVLGLLSVIFLFFLYLFANKALTPFLQDFYFFMFQQIILNHLQETSFVYKDIWYREILKTIYYLLPIIFGIWAAISIKFKPLFIICLFVVFYYLLGIRPTTDFTHLVPLLAITGLPIGIIFESINDKKLKILMFLFSIFLIGLGFYTAIYRNYYRWDTPLMYQNYMSSNPHVGVYSDKKYLNTISSLFNFTNENTKPGQPIFIYSFAPTLYLVLNRENPTKYIFIPVGIRTKKDDQEIINELKKYKITLIIADANIAADKTTLSKYIQHFYFLKFKITDFTVWKR